jgi:hypothetical protein
MRKLILSLPCLIMLFGCASIMLGCASEPKRRMASEYMFSTDRATSTLFGDVKNKFSEHKYVTDKQDAGAGILLMAPRTFSFTCDGHKAWAHQLVQMRQEGASLKIRLAYECNYTGDEKTFGPCLEEDPQLSSKIDRIEAAFIDVLKPILQGGRQTASSHLLDDKPLDSK